MAISRLFFEISGDSSKLNQELKKAVDAAKSAGVEVTRAGQAFISKFDEALNPTKRLAEQIDLLQKSGKSNSDIWRVMSDEIGRATDAAKRHGQAIDPLVKSLQDLNKESLASKIGFENIGKAVGDFATHPVEAARNGISSLLGFLGPTAVGIGAVAAGAIAAGVAVFEFARDAAHAAEEIKNLSYATGMSVERVQALNRLGQEKGLGDLTGSIEKLNLQLGKSEGGPFTEAILKAGIAPKAGADAIYYLEQLREKYAQITDPSERAQKATADLGRRLLDLLPIVLNNKDNFAKLIDELEHGNAVMTGPQIDALTQLHEEINKHSRAWEEVKNKAKEYAGEVTLAFMKAVEEAHRAMTEMSPEDWKEDAINNPRDWEGSSGKATDWEWSYGVVPSGPGRDVFAERSRQIAEADAYAAGTRKELIALTVQLNSLEKQYTEEKSRQKGLDFDADQLLSLAKQIDSKKELIKTQAEQLKQQDELNKRADEFLKYGDKNAAKVTQAIQNEFYEMARKAQEDQMKGILDFIAEQEKKRIETGKAYGAFEQTLSKALGDAEVERLKTEQQISDTIAPRNEQERELMQLQRIHSQAMIEAEETRLKYAKIRAELEAKMAQMQPGSDAAQWAQEEIGQLDAALQKALSDITRKEGAQTLAVHRAEYQKMIDQVKQGAGEIFDAITTKGKSAFEGLKDWIENTLMSKLKSIFENFIAAMLSGGKLSLQGLLGGIIPSAAMGGGAAAGEWGNALPPDVAELQKIMGGGEVFTVPQKGIFGLGGKSGGLVQSGLMMGGSMALMDSFSRGGAGGWAESIGGGAAMGAAIGSVIPGLGTAIGAAIGAAFGALSKSIQALVAGITGKNSYQAGVAEVSRDYGGVAMQQDQYQKMLDQFGLSESQAYGARASINASPQMLQQMYELAKEQGKVAQFMSALSSKTYMGVTGDFKQAFELGTITDDWSKLNDEFSKSQYYNDLVARGFKEQADAMMIAGASANKLLDSFKGLRESVKNSVSDPLSRAIDQFLNAGKMTDALRNEIQRFGGDMAAFDRSANLSQLNGYFSEMVQHFKDTKEILPDLSRIAGEYGANLQVMGDAAARLGELTQKANFLSGMSGGLANIRQQFDPTQLFMGGDFGSRVQTALMKAGLPLDQFSKLSGLIGANQNWDQMAQQATSGGTVSQQLLDMLSQYGGQRGQGAVAQYGQGVNTISADLLGQTRINMQEALDQALGDNIDYLGGIEKETNDQISALTDTVEEQLQTAGDNLQSAVDGAKEALLDVLDRILIAIYESGATTGATNAGSGSTAYSYSPSGYSAPEDAVIVGHAVPRLADGGLILKTGLAIVDKGERFDGGRGGSGATVIVQAQNFYGWSDFVTEVRRAGIELGGRGMPLTKPGF
jgi:hypothetical protein